MGLRDRSAAHFRQYRGQNLKVADKTIKRIIGYPIVSHLDAQVNADGFYEARPACQRLGHHDTQNVEADTVGEVRQTQDQAGRSEAPPCEHQSLKRSTYAGRNLKKITRMK